MPAKLTTEQFIERSKQVHGDKYDYSQTVYIHSKTKVSISCPIHGSYEQEPNSHLLGSGCPSCSGGVRYTAEQFVSRSKEIHNNKYDYSLVNYVNSYTKITILCPIHGSYLQQPNEHIRGKGCAHCTGNKARQAKAASEFVSKAQSIHNNKYSYELVNYVNAQTKILITCPNHGGYEQAPKHHLAGNGCPHCARAEKGWTRTKFKDLCDKNNNGLGILYVLECFNDNEKFIKIGITSNSIQKRYPSKTSMPYAYRVIDEIVGDPEYIFDLESNLHNLNKEDHYVPSIPFGGSIHECFKTNNNK